MVRYLKGQFLIIDSNTGELMSSKVYQSRGLAKRVLDKYKNNRYYDHYRIIEIPSALLLELYENQVTS